MFHALKNSRLYRKLRTWTVIWRLRKLWKGTRAGLPQAWELFADLEPEEAHEVEWLLELKKISMLHFDSLLALRHLARTCRGTILEVGAFIGGATIAMAAAIKDQHPRRRLLAVEKGGSHALHPYLPTHDILGMLKENLRKHHVQDAVTILNGWSYEPAIVAEIIEVARTEPIGLLVLDANGENIQSELERLEPYCLSNCHLVFDDYTEMRKVPIKAPHVQATVDRLLRQGRIRQVGVLPWGTWFGRLAS
jgi:predicted O-methyltransferase YrrM